MFGVVAVVRVAVDAVVIVAFVPAFFVFGVVAVAVAAAVAASVDAVAVGCFALVACCGQPAVVLLRTERCTRIRQKRHHTPQRVKKKYKSTGAVGFLNEINKKRVVYLFVFRDFSISPWSGSRKMGSGVGLYFFHVNPCRMRHFFQVDDGLSESDPECCSDADKAETERRLAPYRSFSEDGLSSKAARAMTCYPGTLTRWRLFFTRPAKTPLGVASVPANVNGRFLFAANRHTVFVLTPIMVHEFADASSCIATMGTDKIIVYCITCAYTVMA